MAVTGLVLGNWYEVRSDNRPTILNPKEKVQKENVF